MYSDFIAAKVQRCLIQIATLLWDCRQLVLNVFQCLHVGTPAKGRLEDFNLICAGYARGLRVP